MPLSFSEFSLPLPLPAAAFDAGACLWPPATPLPTLITSVASTSSGRVPLHPLSKLEGPSCSATWPSPAPATAFDLASDGTLFLLRACGVLAMGIGQPCLAAHVFRAFLAQCGSRPCSEGRVGVPCPLPTDALVATDSLWFMLGRCCEQAMDLPAAIRCLR